MAVAVSRHTTRVTPSLKALPRFDAEAAPCEPAQPASARTRADPIIDAGRHETAGRIRRKSPKIRL